MRGKICLGMEDWEEWESLESRILGRRYDPWLGVKYSGQGKEEDWEHLGCDRIKKL